jgi:hypothetical protein
MLNRDLSVFDEVHSCPHCQQQLTCCDAPPFHIGDGLGWGSEVLFICLNDECSLFVEGWKHIEEQFGHVSSYRYMILPGEAIGSPMMVASKDAFKGCVADIEGIKMQNKRYADEKEALAQLDQCLEQKNLAPVMSLILNEGAAMEGREKACELLCRFNDIGCIDALRNHTFRNEALEYKVNMAISKLLKENFKIECPHCAEIIKAQAKICKHCNRQVKED